MRVPGRITIFGEAYGGLLERATFSVPARQAIYCGYEAHHWTGVQRYDRHKDEIGSLLVRRGLIDNARDDLAGDLPLNFGLASSTAVAIAHLSDEPRELWSEAVAAVDEDVHGFKPTGADYAAVSHAEAGCFGMGEWTAVPFGLPPGSHLVLPGQEGRDAKAETATLMREDQSTLGPLIEEMSRDLIGGRGLTMPALLQYAERLFGLGVYSPQQRLMIEPLLAKGIVAKGVGSMYDRAVLVMASPEVWREEAQYEVLLQDS